MRTIVEVIEDIKSILNNIERTEECNGETLVDINELADEILTINSITNESVKGDLISRSALLEVLTAERKQDRSRAYAEHECDLIAGTIAMCADFVKAMPTACNDGWIPCSERLPEEYGEYLCCNRSGEYILGFPNAKILGDGFYVDNDTEGLDNVTHWQPLPSLPQPYKEDENE